MTETNLAYPHRNGRSDYIVATNALYLSAGLIMLALTLWLATGAK